MKVINKLCELDDESGLALAIGTFDGFHLAHREVICNMKKMAKNDNLKTGILAFSNIPRHLSDDREISIFTYDDKIECAMEFDVDYLILLPFDESIKNTTREEFLDVLITKLKCRAISVGYNFRFGKNASGSAQWLMQVKDEHNIDISVTEEICDEIGAISSTRIRGYLQNGDIEKANSLLGRHYFMTGSVKHGKALGRKIGFPTANIEIKDNISVLARGVYFTKCKIADGRVFNAITNVGLNPTFDGSILKLETYLFDFSEDLYDQKIRISFYKMTRKEKKFSGVEELKEQISRDFTEAKNYFDEN